MKYRFTYIILFDSGDAYGLLSLNGKLIKRTVWKFEFIGNFTKDVLKKMFPNTSIRLQNDNNISKIEKESLKSVYRKEKILKLLKENHE